MTFSFYILILKNEKSYTIKERDRIKTKFCFNNNIKLFRIKYNDDIEDKLFNLINLI